MRTGDRQFSCSAFTAAALRFVAHNAYERMPWSCLASAEDGSIASRNHRYHSNCNVAPREPMRNASAIGEARGSAKKSYLAFALEGRASRVGSLPCGRLGCGAREPLFPISALRAVSNCPPPPITPMLRTSSPRSGRAPANFRQHKGAQGRSSLQLGQRPLFARSATSRRQEAQ